MSRTGLPSILVLTLACLIAPAAGGCVSSTTVKDGNEIDRTLIQGIKVGETTKAQVLEKLGSPTHVLLRDVSSIVESMVSRAPVDQLTVQLDPALLNEIYVYEQSENRRLIVLVGFYNYFFSDTRYDRLTIVFDRQSVVLGVGYTEGTREF